MNKPYVLSGRLDPTPEVVEWMNNTIQQAERDKEKALRLYFLMTFKIPLGCADGDKTIFYAHNREYYIYKGTPFAYVDTTDCLSINPMLTEDAQYRWLCDMPMKEFAIFGRTYKK